MVSSEKVTVWKVSPPQVSAESAARSSVTRIRDPDRAKRVRAVLAEFTSNSVDLQYKARNHDTASILSSPPSITGVSGSELKWLYDAQVAKKGRPANKDVYERLLALAPYGLCSYCQYGTAKTLDHFVPKALVPALAIDPWNLVPSCHECNHEMREDYSSAADEQFLHPYAIPSVGRWLRAAVTHTDPVAVSFSADPDKTVDLSIVARIRHQFGRLKLGAMYSVASAPELTELSRMLQREFGQGRPDDVRLTLTRDASAAQEVDVNSRRGAMLEALASDDWYCEKGYSLVHVTRLP